VEALTPVANECARSLQSRGCRCHISRDRCRLEKRHRGPSPEDLGPRCYDTHLYSDSLKIWWCQTAQTGCYRCHDPMWLPGPPIPTRPDRADPRRLGCTSVCPPRQHVGAVGPGPELQPGQSAAARRRPRAHLAPVVQGRWRRRPGGLWPRGQRLPPEPCAAGQAEVWTPRLCCEPRSQSAPTSRQRVASSTRVDLACSGCCTGWARLAQGSGGAAAGMARRGMAHRKPGAVSRQLDPDKQAQSIPSYKHLLNQIGDDAAALSADALILARPRMRCGRSVAGGRSMFRPRCHRAAVVSG
jgi:hypothetical protein